MEEEVQHLESANELKKAGKLELSVSIMTSINFSLSSS
jgi:hypothetical protein